MNSVEISIYKHKFKKYNNIGTYVKFNKLYFRRDHVKRFYIESCKSIQPLTTQDLFLVTYILFLFLLIVKLLKVFFIFKNKEMNY